MIVFNCLGDNTEARGKLKSIGGCRGFSFLKKKYKLGMLLKLSIKSVEFNEDNDDVWIHTQKPTDLIWLWLDGVRLFASLIVQLKQWLGWFDGSWVWFLFSSVLLLEILSHFNFKHLGQRFFGIFAKECLLTFNKFLERAQWLELSDLMVFI